MPEKMSTSSQNNGKKSSNSSIVNTPSSTPLTTTANGSQVNIQSSPPPNNNAPKYGTLVPNRIFVGGISASTTEGELMQLFSNYGTVKAAKIIQDRAGVSKGYGFITFESEDDAKRPLREAENIVLRERKLNIAPAIKKQPFGRTFDASSPPAVSAGNPPPFYFPAATAVPYFQGGVAYYAQPTPSTPGDPNTQQPVYQPPPVYPTQTGPPQAATYPSMMFPTQAIYMPQQYPMHMPYDYNYYQSNGGPPVPQYLVNGQGGTGGPQCPPMPPSNSPPRPPCYSQQIPTYNTAADPMFYNLPIYGAAMEGPPIYTDAYELAAPGPYTEGCYNMADHPVTTPSQDIDTATHISTSIVKDSMFRRPNTAHIQNSLLMDNVNNSTEGSKSLNDTPVVSLLSIDQHQEKDYLSMQGGRRCKSVAQNTQQAYNSNGYPFPIGFNPFNNNVCAASSSNYRRTNGGFDNRTFRNRRRPFDNSRRSNDHSSRSSVRTDSNSSASCVDENRNEEKPLTTIMRTSVNTPPPAPYSPMTHQYKIITNSARNFQNTVRYNGNNNYWPAAAAAKIRNNSNSSSSNNSNLSCPISPQSYVPQVHVATSQSFVPQARRNRRSIRRNGSSGVSEIGAGDAPLPGDVVAAGDVCKKFETLKL